MRNGYWCVQLRSQLVLAVGNYLNAGSFRGGAYGFQLEILPKVRHQALNNGTCAR